MKKIILVLLVCSCICFNLVLKAQQTPALGQNDSLQKLEQPERPERLERSERPQHPDRRERAERPEGKEEQEITIRSKGDTNFTLKLEISGDKVIINGKPLVEFNNGGITINKKKMIFKDGNGNMNFDFKGLEGLKDLQNIQFDLQKGQFEMDKALENLHRTFGKKTFLGVTTEKAADGAMIVEIVKGGAAEKAGLQKKDVITKIDNQTVTDADVLASIIATKKPLDEIKIHFKRNGKKKDVKAILGESSTMEKNFNFNAPPSTMHIFKAPHTNNDMMDEENNEGDNEDNFAGDFPRPKRLGLKISDTEEGGNVKVIEVADSSVAQIAGLKKDDVITEINGQKINNTDEAREQLQQAEENAAYTIKAKRAGVVKSFEIKFPKKLKTANL